jgi:hypothetical protein
VVRFEKESHAKAQRRKEEREEVEGFFALRAFFAPLRLQRETAFPFAPSATGPLPERGFQPFLLDSGF